MFVESAHFLFGKQWLALFVGNSNFIVCSGSCFAVKLHSRTRLKSRKLHAASVSQLTGAAMQALGLLKPGEQTAGTRSQIQNAQYTMSWTPEVVQKSQEWVHKTEFASAEERLECSPSCMSHEASAPSKEACDVKSQGLLRWWKFC